ncbi:uncharacterized protein LY89DRAFT_66420 [Mollisia scopiformis]|uniref:DUF6697 domain-containing protein n=1 Tax=Mollisia scopiformis TaxID=149040 RepID=A0A194X9P6_MOLSC|nr:uncharacterized protein LY89DRAFT_66420 [Mollisia scopiformis]KUJ16849.1 hypothetical protein LY89DRAFT_66420 [Mollisia scopiformis]
MADRKRSQLTMSSPPSPHKRAKISPNTYELRQIFGEAKMLLDNSANKTWTMTHESEQKFFILFDERGEHVQAILTAPFSSIDYTIGDPKVIAHSHHQDRNLNPRQLYMEFSDPQQSANFVEDMVSTCNLKARRRETDYLSKAFTILENNKFDHTRSISKRIAEEQPEDVRLTLARSPGVRHANKPSPDSGMSTATNSQIAPLDRSSTKRNVVSLEKDFERDGTDELTVYNTGTPEQRHNLQEVIQVLAGQRLEALFEEDQKLVELTKTSITLYQGMRMPVFIEQLEMLPNVQISRQPNQAFTLAFLKRVLGGHARAEGCYAVPPKSRTNRLFPDVIAFKALNPNHDPLLPRHPGQHGAQISCIPRSGDESLGEFPLFIQHSEGGYRYFGYYREPRELDLIGGSEISQVPKHVNQYWAKYLGRATRHTPKSQMALNALVHGWPRVAIGWLPKGRKDLLAYDPDIVEDDDDLAIQRPITEAEAEEIEEARVLEALEKADNGRGETFRLWYEYLECVSYDQEFYKKLVIKQHEFNT